MDVQWIEEWLKEAKAKAISIKLKTPNEIEGEIQTKLAAQKEKLVKDTGFLKQA